MSEEEFLFLFFSRGKSRATKGERKVIGLIQEPFFSQRRRMKDEGRNKEIELI